jgi:hypothetical protein
LRRAHEFLSDITKCVGTLRFVVLSQKVARWERKNQVFEKIQDWRLRC